jgi:8-oxo-dGTP pyrophosphatase MutT (NUDIX family)
MVQRINVQALVFCNHPSFMLLVLKRTPERGGYWQPVCGGVEPGEERIDAAVREVSEETGIIHIRSIIDLDYTFTYRADKNGVTMDMQDYCFAVQIEHPADIQLSDEHEAYAWLSYAEAIQCLKWEHNLIALQKLMQQL